MDDSQKHIEQGFAPVLGKGARVLILGTMPSVKSLQALQYYGHPRNAFWWIMSQLCGFESELSYSQRVERVKDRGVALWDVAHSCHRPGSLDSNIDQSTLKANDIQALLKNNPSIDLVAFNGQTAAKLYKKFASAPAYLGEMLSLPSTSPANAGMSKESKLDQWSALKPHLFID